jgi:hypothetical protein
MGNRIKSVCLAVSCVVCVYLTGCFPEDSVEWSADGSTGLYRAEEALYLVDGDSGELTRIEADGVGIMPDISRDGQLIAYVKDIEADNLDEGWQCFPERVVSGIQEQARQLAERVAMGRESLSDDALKLGPGEHYRGWVIRALCETADAALKEKIGRQRLEELGTRELRYSELVLTHRDNLTDKRVIVALPAEVFRPRFSPDGRYLAYMMPGPENEEAGILLVASVDGQTEAMVVTHHVALGYEWRPDSKALAYIKQDGDPILGVLEEKIVIGEDGVPLAAPVDATAGSVATSRATRRGKQFVGTLFQPVMHVAYGLDGRILLSSAAASIPTAELDEPQYALFCYDRVMGTVTNILPGVLRSQASQNMNFFRLSPDGRRLLIPLQHNRFAVYEPGSNEGVFPIEPNEGFGTDEMPDFVPAWKGNDRITCLVSENSHFLAREDGQKARRKEIVVIDTNGQLLSVLSEDWPDSVIAGDPQDEVDRAVQQNQSQ